MAGKKCRQMLEGKKKLTGTQFFDLVVEAVQFVIVNYFLSSALLSLRASLWYIPIFAIFAAFIGKFWTMLKRNFCSIIWPAAILSVCLLAVAALIYFVGYLPISETPVKLA